MNKPQRIAAWEAKIAPIVAAFQRLRDATDKANEAGTLDPNGELFMATWRAFEELLGMLDSGGWIGWYLYDNRCGKRDFEATPCAGKKRRKVSTPRQLARLIVQWEDGQD
jgi:lauroyl/myristoyl acyltransferase